MIRGLPENFEYDKGIASLTGIYYTAINYIQSSTNGICFICPEFFREIYDAPSCRYEGIPRLQKSELDSARQRMVVIIVGDLCFSSGTGQVIDEESSVAIIYVQAIVDQIAIIIAYQPFGLIDFVLADKIP